MIGERGELMGVPKFCLYMTPSKRKYVESKTNFKAFKNSSRGIEQLLGMCPHFYNTINSQVKWNICEKRNYIKRY